MLTALKKPHFSLKWTDLCGALIVCIAISLSSAAIANGLDPVGGAANAQLLLGATIFRFNLAILGLLVIVLPRLPLWDTSRAVPETAANSRRRIILLCLAALLAVAALLRLYDLNDGLWLDEILTDVLFVRQPLGTILSRFESENQHFLYSILGYLSYQLFGANAWALRLPAVVFGVASIGALYLFGRRVTGARETLLAAALLTFSYQHIWFSQNARGYTGLLLWTLLASWLFLRGLEEHQPRIWIWYAVAAALGVYVNFTMLFVIASHFVLYLMYLIVRRHRVWQSRWTGLCIGFGLAAFFTLLLYSLVLPQVATGMGREPSLVEAWKNPLWTLTEFANGIQLSFGSSVAILAGLVVFGAGIWSYARTKPLVLGLLFLPALLCAVVVIALGHHLWPRFFFFVLGFAALVAIRGAVALGQWCAERIRLNPHHARWAGSLFGIGVVLAAALSTPLVYAPKQDYVGAMNFVQAQKQPGDVIATGGLATLPYIEFYNTGWVVVKNAAALEAVRSDAKRTWFVYSFPTVLEADSPDLMDLVQREFHVLKIFYGTVGDGAVIVCRYDGATAGP